MDKKTTKKLVFQIFSQKNDREMLSSKQKPTISLIKTIQRSKKLKT